MTVAKDPLTLSTEVMGGLTGAVLAAEVAALAVLKAEMEGLSILFGGDAGPRSDAERLAEDAAEEASFDNMPV